MQCTFCIVPLVVAAVYLVTYMAVLQIGIYVETSGQAVVGFKVYVGIVLCSVVAVVFMVWLKVADVFLYPQHMTEVPSEVAV